MASAVIERQFQLRPQILRQRGPKTKLLIQKRSNEQSKSVGADDKFGLSKLLGQFKSDRFYVKQVSCRLHSIQAQIGDCPRRIWVPARSLSLDTQNGGSSNAVKSHAQSRKPKIISNILHITEVVG